MRISNRMMLLAAALLITLGGCEGVTGPGTGPYVGGDIGAHKDGR